MPGDMSSDMGNVAANMFMKTAEAAVNTLKELVAKLFEVWEKRTSAEYKLSKAKLKEQNLGLREQRAVQRINGKVGFVRHKELQRAGVPLSVTGIRCTEEELKNLSAACKRNGIVITAQDDIRSRELGGSRLFVVECRQSDLQRLLDLVDSMNDAKRIEFLRAEKEAVLSLGEAMTEEDRLYVEQIDREIAAIRNGDCARLNEQQAKGEIEKAVNDGKNYSGVNLSEALDRWTGGEIDRETTCYVVDAKDPDKYIEVNARNEVFNGEQYIKSTYDVYNGEKKVFSTHDGRFDERPKDYWYNQKEAIKAEGGIGDTVIKFYDRAEMEAYREYYRSQNSREIVGLEKEAALGNYEAVKAELFAKMDECGAAYKDGVAVNKETGEPLRVTEDMGLEKQAAVAEAAVCAEQIAVYSKMEQLQIDMAAAKADVLLTTPGSPDHAKAAAKIESLEKQLHSAEETSRSLMERRKGVNFVQAEQERKEAVLDRTANRPAPAKQTMKQVKSEIKNRKEAVAGENKVTHGAAVKTVKKTAKAPVR